MPCFMVDEVPVKATVSKPRGVQADIVPLIFIVPGENVELERTVRRVAWVIQMIANQKAQYDTGVKQEIRTVEIVRDKLNTAALQAKAVARRFVDIKCPRHFGISVRVAHG